MVCGSAPQRVTLPQTPKTTNDLGLLYKKKESKIVACQIDEQADGAVRSVCNLTI